MDHPAGLEHHFEAFIEAARRFDEQPGQPQRSARLLAYPADLPFWTALLPESSSLELFAHVAGRALSMGGRFDQALAWCERAVEARQPQRMGRLLASLGDLPFWTGVLPESLLLETLADVAGRALSLGGIFNQVLAWCKRAAEAKERSNVHTCVSHDGLGSILHMVGYCHASAGRFDQALPWYERAVEAAEKVNVLSRVDHASLGSSLHHVGYCHSSEERFEQALAWLERAVEAKKGDIHGRVDHNSLGASLDQVGYCHVSAERFDQALSWYERAVEARKKGDIHGRVNHAQDQPRPPT
ncbi:tetratricopeptide repeat protein [Sorangium sp. So ce315]|uniref:tetratricopeptide repeat protein n=1 Tax=Sorangium sp. So ce315 TaxID=3133299 RepID=UPI003F642DAC